MGDWAQLPADLFEQIMDRLTLPDLIRLGCVCAPWRSISLPTRHKGRLPWLIVSLQNNSKEPGNNTSLNPHIFFSILNNSTHNLHIPELADRRICGSSNGWLITIHENADIHLIHPFNRKLIDLPSFLEMPGVHGMSLLDRQLNYIISDHTNPNRRVGYSVNATVVRDHYISKAIVSPTSFVMGIIGEHHSLFFCKLEDNRWQVIRDGNSYCDLTYYKGQFYALEESGHVVVIDGLDSRGPFTRRISQGECDSGDSCPSHVVESSGDLLKVVQVWIRSSEADGDIRQQDKKGFKVFKLDFEQGKWLEITDLGDRALFLGSNHSCSISVSEFPGCKGNCIYCTDNLGDMNVGGCSIYNLEDGTFNTICPDVSPDTLLRAIWYGSM